MSDEFRGSPWHTYLGFVFDGAQNIGQEGVRPQRAVEGDNTSHERPEDHQDMEIPSEQAEKGGHRSQISPFIVRLLYFFPRRPPHSHPLPHGLPPRRRVTG